MQIFSWFKWPKKSLYKNDIFNITTAVLRNTYRKGKDWKEIYQKNNSGWLFGGNGNTVRIFFWFSLSKFCIVSVYYFYKYKYLKYCSKLRIKQ